MRSLVAAAALLVLPASATAQLVRFEDAADRLPPFAIHNTMDVGAADLDGDGDLDLVLPQEFLLNRVLLNEGGRFVDASSRLAPLADDELAAGPAGLRFAGAGHDSEDVSIVDVDGDGVLDLMIVQEDDVKFGRRGVHEFYRGTAAGFQRMRDAGLPDTEADAVAHADVNGDGAIDFLLAGAGQDRLVLGDGRGGFRDATDSRLPRESATAQDAEFADLDGDGHLDLILGLEGGWALWRNDGSGHFIDETAGRLPDPGNVEARKVRVADVDGDGDLDLYFAHVGWQGRQAQDRLVLNDGAGHFTDATDRIPTESGTTLDAAFVDLDGDGDLDLLRADIGPVSAWLNDGTGRFTDVTDEVFGAPVTGPNLALEVADFDGDGVIDLYIGQLRGGQGPATVRDHFLLGRR